MSEEKPIFVCVSRMGVVVPTPEGGSITLREGDEVEGVYYEQVAAVTNGLMLKSAMSKEMLTAVEKRREMRKPGSFPKRMAEVKEAATGRIETVLDAKRQGAVENFRGAIQDAVGASKNSISKEDTPAKNGSKES